MNKRVKRTYRRCVGCDTERNALVVARIQREQIMLAVSLCCSMV